MISRRSFFFAALGLGAFAAGMSKPGLAVEDYSRHRLGTMEMVEAGRDGWRTVSVHDWIRGQEYVVAARVQVGPGEHERIAHAKKILRRALTNTRRTLIATI